MTKEIQLTYGKVALVDDEDYESLSRFKWCTQKSPNTWYAKRAMPRDVGHGIIWMHREILKVPHGLWVDHIDGNGLNNQRDNIRIATHRQNHQNQRLRADSQSGYKGVFAASTIARPWVAQIQVDGRLISLGHFVSKEEAALAYNDAAYEHFGEFAQVNVVDKGVLI